MLIVAIGVTAGTASQVAQKGGLIVLYIGKIFYQYFLPTSTYVGHLLELRSYDNSHGKYLCYL